MNPYKQILTEKYGEKVTKEMMAWVKKFNALRQIGYGDTSKKQLAWIDAEWATIKYSDKESDRLIQMSLAILAELKGRKELKGMATVNMSKVCENSDTVVMRLLFIAQENGFVDLYRVAAPYQIAFYY
jgi:hypothetical protein